MLYYTQNFFQFQLGEHPAYRIQVSGSLHTSDGYGLVWMAIRARVCLPGACSTSCHCSAVFATHCRYTLGARTFPIILAAYEGDDSNANVPAGLGVYKVVEDIV